MQVTKDDLKRLQRLQSEMAEAKEHGELAEYVVDQADYILHCLTLMTYTREEASHDKPAA